MLPIDADPASATPIPPTDFHHILAEKDRAIAERDALIAHQKAANAELQKLLRLMEEELRLARLRKFGARSEKLPFQGELFDEAELEVSLEEVEKELAEAEPKKPRKRHTKADGFDENLP
ncbi:transposase domain-containing protein, partial [Thiolapillus sp.]